MANIVTVSALNKYVKDVLERDPVLTDIAIRGEISNFNKHYKTGHCYFSLKDDTASVKAVMFRSSAQQLAFEPKNGMNVIARCRISLYERDGAFQLYVDDLFPDGIGAAQMAFEQLKEKLNAEGLFAPEHKKPIPAYPQKIGLVTSKTGAALQDIINIASRRYPSIVFVLAPVTVQGGQEAAEGIAKAIDRLDALNDLDTIIVARGGGSAEDLWVFNAEVIARAAFRCATPLISAIGHEIDYTILDFVADLRAPTPSAAAELALPDIQQVQRNMMNIFVNITNIMHNRLDSCYNNLSAARSHSAFIRVKELPVTKADALYEYSQLAEHAIHKKMADASKRLENSVKLADGISPYAVLGRGYSVVRHGEQAVTSVKEVAVGQQIDVTIQDGALSCTIDSINEAARKIEKH